MLMIGEVRDPDFSISFQSLNQRGACLLLFDAPVSRAGWFRVGKVTRKRRAQNNVDTKSFGANSPWESWRHWHGDPEGDLPLILSVVLTAELWLHLLRTGG